MSNPLKIAPPPRRPRAVEAEPALMPEPEDAMRPKAWPEAGGSKFRQAKEDEMVQFNKRVARRVADGFEMLAIRSRRRVPTLLAEALQLLEDHYGKV
jgi:hypothetical protein